MARLIRETFSRLPRGGDGRVEAERTENKEPSSDSSKLEDTQPTNSDQGRVPGPVQPLDSSLNQPEENDTPVTPSKLRLKRKKTKPASKVDKKSRKVKASDTVRTSKRLGPRLKEEEITEPTLEESDESENTEASDPPQSEDNDVAGDGTSSQALPEQDQVPVEQKKPRKRLLKECLTPQESVVFQAVAPQDALPYADYDKDGVRDHYIKWAVQNGFSIHIRRSNVKELLGSVFVRFTCKENRTQRSRRAGKGADDNTPKPCPWSLRVTRRYDHTNGQFFWIPNQVCADHNHDPLPDAKDHIAYRKLFKRTHAKVLMESVEQGKDYEETLRELKKQQSLRHQSIYDIPISKKDLSNARISIKSERSLLFPKEELEAHLL